VPAPSPCGTHCCPDGQLIPKHAPWQPKLPLHTHSGTDAFGIQVAREGIPTMVVSLPLRNMHTPVEQLSVKDVTRAGRLLAEFIAGLKEDFVSTLAFE